MSIEVRVPTLGESITSGILTEWHVDDGAFIRSGQPIYDLETDKITSEGMAEADGRISLSVQKGEEVEIGQILAIIDETAQATKSDDDTAEAEVSDDGKSGGRVGHAVGDASPEKSAKNDRPLPPSKPPSAEGSRGQSLHSPAVRHHLVASAIDPSTIAGTGKGGRITKGDVFEEHKDSAEASEISSQGEPSQSDQERPSEARTTRRRISPLRRRIAERLVAAQQTAAILSTFNEVDMSSVMAFRRKHQDAFTDKHGIKLGFMSFFVKAVVHALKEVPSLNAQMEGDYVIENHFFDIGVAVSTEKGLMVPVVRDCDSLNFADVEKRIVELVQKARTGKIQIEDLQGGVFTISNGGIYGSMLSTPILNQPQSGILGMHAIKDRPVVVEGEIVVRPMMYLALSYDHRLVDGASSVNFLIKVKESIEDPSRLLFEI